MRGCGVQLYALVCVRVTDCKANEKSKRGRVCAMVNGCMEVLTCVTAPIGSAGVVLGEIRGSGTSRDRLPLTEELCVCLTCAQFHLF